MEIFTEIHCTYIPESKAVKIPAKFMLKELFSLGGTKHAKTAEIQIYDRFILGRIS